jgi:uncharacterized membrane protein YeaQ/YmgE (transglycosylase-associated protein family)
MNMSWNLVVFALIGLFAGGAARLFYPGRQFMHILGTMVLGMTGALLGGLLSWSIWSAEAGDIHTAALLLSLLGALLALVLWPGTVYVRRLRGAA